MDRISQSLLKLFEKHRVVFWYDTKDELFSEFDLIDLPGIEKVVVDNNEFAVKYRILRQDPGRKFLLYRKGAQPPDDKNWLLDVLLSNGEFKADQAGLWLSELDLGYEFSEIVSSHTDFFKSAKRIESLKSKRDARDNHNRVRLKMLAVCAESQPTIDDILRNLLGEYAAGRSQRIDLIGKCCLDSFLWKKAEEQFGYESATRSVKDFVIHLFKSCYAMETGGTSSLNTEALVFIKRWKDSITHKDAFERLSAECADLLDIEDSLHKSDYRQLLHTDLFRLIDPKILSDLVKCVADNTISSMECSDYIGQRRQSHWFNEFEHIYEAVDHAAKLLEEINLNGLNVQSFSDGINQYTNSWYRMDLYYRKYIYHMREASQASLLQKLTEQVEAKYTNNFLLKINDHWQKQIDAATVWDAEDYPLQRQFHKEFVQPFLDNQKKVYVIISDALRYEIGDELVSRIRQEDRYDAELEPIISMLPSYTQLCMAALLPNKEMEFADNDTGNVIVDGISSAGLAYRNKILSQGCSAKAATIKAEDILGMTREMCRDLINEVSVLYIYHNRIDSVGDKRESEELVFEAVEDAIQDIINVVKKLTAANATNLIVTADHGFIYQNQSIDESDFLGEEPSGEILYRDRRFVLGKGLQDKNSLKKFQSADLGLGGDIEIQIPKSINRLRLQGSGSRYVHGGASLQEIIVPVVRINKKRVSDISFVDVDILKGTSNSITTSQLSVIFYQRQPVTEKRKARTLRAGIYTESGDLISDRHDLVFDLTNELEREREKAVRFILTKEADDANNQEVVLRLEELTPGTSHYKVYRTERYLIKRSFSGDFEF